MENANRQSQNNEVFTVTQATAVAREVPAVIAATGSLIASESSDIAPRAAGKVVNVGVNVGEFVGQGTIIAKLDERDAQLQLAQATANVAQTVSAVRQAEARLGLAVNGSFSAGAIPEVRAANAIYEQAIAELRQAEANEKRYRELVETGDVSLQNYENYRTLRDTARARVSNALQNLEGARNAARQNNEAIKSAQAAVNAAGTQIDLAKQAIADTVIRAPFAGFISNRPVAVGEFVTTATAVATLLRTNPIKAQLQVAEANVPYISIGRGVSIEVDAYRDRKFAGTITAINPALETTSRSVIVEASIENGDNALRTGMFATANITREGGSTGIFVPKAAVINDQSTQAFRAFVIQDGVVKLRVVQLGTEENDFVQILTGINADETVATSNLDKLYEGAKVSF
ncbi:MAG: efflux RND transporter periplasmic adaptor subunit [Pyrinomonadaceae bacterium]|nr:efflux RND transporter periplasmic adaptor subunit [Pyrinomonadaceae bacterium]